MPVLSSTPRVAVFDAIEDQLQLTTATLRVLGCGVHTLVPGDNGLQDVVDQLGRNGPFDVILWDIPHALQAPCVEFGDMHRRGAFAASGVIVTTTDRDRLAPLLDAMSADLAILARPFTFTSLMQAIAAATATGERVALAAGSEDALAGVPCRLHKPPAR